MIYENELYHHGVKGQKWGVRRYQNPDGTLTPAGQRRYRKAEMYREHNIEVYRQIRNNAINRSMTANANEANRHIHAYRNMSNEDVAQEQGRINRNATISWLAGGVAAGIPVTALTVRSAAQQRVERFASDYRDMSLSELEAEMRNERY